MSAARDQPPIRGHSQLVIGGARSGKTRFGLELAEELGREKWMIATAQGSDGEMRDRIARHKAERDASWTVVEEPLNLVESLRQSASPERVVLVDCLTLWLSNLFLAEADVVAEINKLAGWIETRFGHVILISNELGLGLVPDNRLGRSFRDQHGSMNQAIASACHAVTFVAAGLPLKLK